VAHYYSERLRQHGATPEGVDWNSQAGQQLRFTQLLKLLDPGREYSVIDYGCGYGALAERLIACGASFTYTGFDVSESMVDTARRAIDDPRCRFTAQEAELVPADVTLASGIFNVKLTASDEEWQGYVEATLESLARLSRVGFAFNVLTRYSHPERRSPTLFYADPSDYMRLCKERFSRNVALLHDYDLFEFTVIVRLGAETVDLA
jgi:SAM-dependent methyltransferase